MRSLRTETIVHDVARTDLAVRREEYWARNYFGPEFGQSAKGLALPKAAVSGVALEAVLRRLTRRQRSDAFDQLPIPFHAVATDVVTAEMVVIAVDIGTPVRVRNELNSWSFGRWFKSNTAYHS
jgi:NTE family protein